MLETVWKNRWLPDLIKTLLKRFLIKKPLESESFPVFIYKSLISDEIAGKAPTT